MDAQPVPEPAAGPTSHPLVAATEQSLLAAKPDEHGILRTKAASEAFDVAVGPASVARAVAIVSAFLAKAAAAGIGVRIDEPRRWDPRRRTVATVDGEVLAVRLMEHWRQRPHKPTDDERASHKRHPYETLRRWDYRPSGILYLTICDAAQGWSGRLWTDGRRAPLERKLDLVIAGLQAMAAGIKERRAEHLRWEKEAAERRRREAEEAQRLRKEQEFQDSLLADAENWRRSRLLRRYVSEVQSHVLTCCGPVQNERLGSWVGRALAVADLLDPMLRIEPD